jgi:hypothetical protein
MGKLGRSLSTIIGLALLGLGGACSSSSGGGGGNNDCDAACANAIQLCQTGSVSECVNECKEHFSPNQQLCLKSATSCVEATDCGGAAGWSCYEDPAGDFCNCKNPPDPKDSAQTCSATYPCCVSDGSTCECVSANTLGSQHCFDWAGARTVVDSCPFGA